MSQKQSTNSVSSAIAPRPGKLQPGDGTQKQSCKFTSASFEGKRIVFEALADGFDQGHIPIMICQLFQLASYKLRAWSLHRICEAGFHPRLPCLWSIVKGRVS